MRRKQQAEEDCESCPDSKDFVAKMQKAALSEEVPRAPTPEQVGRSTWTFLHTFASTYPDKPDDSTQQHAFALLRALGSVYPCRTCRDDWSEELNKNPPQVQSRTELERWMCDQHNGVNSKLGKPLFDCSKVQTCFLWLFCLFQVFLVIKRCVRDGRSRNNESLSLFLLHKTDCNQAQHSVSYKHQQQHQTPVPHHHVAHRVQLQNCFACCQTTRSCVCSRVGTNKRFSRKLIHKL
jgi:FAD-linked sulfhydryl oxidase